MFFVNALNIFLFLDYICHDYCFKFTFGFYLRQFWSFAQSISNVFYFVRNHDSDYLWNTMFRAAAAWTCPQVHRIFDRRNEKKSDFFLSSLSSSLIYCYRTQCADYRYRIFHFYIQHIDMPSSTFTLTTKNLIIFDFIWMCEFVTYYHYYNDKNNRNHNDRQSKSVMHRSCYSPCVVHGIILKSFYYHLNQYMMMIKNFYSLLDSKQCF